VPEEPSCILSRHGLKRLAHRSDQCLAGACLGFAYQLMVAGPVASGADAKAHKDNPTQHPTQHPTTQNNGWGDSNGGGKGHKGHKDNPSPCPSC
jgi:hypothetical protein